MAPMASTLYGAAHGYDSVPSELPSTAYETSKLPRPRRRNRVGKVLAVGVVTATVLLTVALSANIKFPRKVPRVRRRTPRRAASSLNSQLAPLASVL